MYGRFKDDIDMASVGLEKGTKFMDGKLVVDEEKKETDQERRDEYITMEIIKEVAETVDPMIKLTTDVPTNYSEGYLHILDLKVKVNKEERNRIHFHFFQKPPKNGTLLLPDAAFPAKQRRTILTQE